MGKKEETISPDVDANGDREDMPTALPEPVEKDAAVIEEMKAAEDLLKNQKSSKRHLKLKQSQS